jgi:hypothetical protein
MSRRLLTLLTILGLLAAAAAPAAAEDPWIRLPVDTGAPRWSPDSRSLLLTAYRPVTIDGTTIYSRTGFVTVSVADRRARVVKVRSGPQSFRRRSTSTAGSAGRPTGPGCWGTCSPEGWTSTPWRSTTCAVLASASTRTSARWPASTARRRSRRRQVVRHEDPEAVRWRGQHPRRRPPDRRRPFSSDGRPAHRLLRLVRRDHLILSYLDKNMAMTYKVVDLSGEPGIP